MSAVVKEDDTVLFCACCGTAGSDDIKLKRCNACNLVRYCSVKCQKDHRPKHKRECKKRAAELQDEILFKQPESSHLGDCPICMLPLPLDQKKSCLFSCCGKDICTGCEHANWKREIEGKLQQRCPFCRTDAPKTEEEINKRWMRRVEANDPVAMCQVGTKRCEEGDYKAAFEYWTKAAALGDVAAHYQLSTLYGEGLGVEKDQKRELHHAVHAAIRGHPRARHNLGYEEFRSGRMDRAVKHFIIAAKLGYDDSLRYMKDFYKHGCVSKEDFESALRGYQASIAARESPQREEATKFTSSVG